MRVLTASEGWWLIKIYHTSFDISGALDFSRKSGSFRIDGYLAFAPERITWLFQDIARIQTEFVQPQMTAFVEQVKSICEAYKATAGAVTMPF